MILFYFKFYKIEIEISSKLIIFIYKNNILLKKIHIKKTELICFFQYHLSKTFYNISNKVEIRDTVYNLKKKNLCFLIKYNYTITQ